MDPTLVPQKLLWSNLKYLPTYLLPTYYLPTTYLLGRSYLMGIVDGWMDEEDELFLFFFYGWVGLVGGSILALIRFCSLATYVFFVFSFGLFGEGLLLYLVN